MPRSLIFAIALSTLSSGCADGVIATADTSLNDDRPWVERSAPLDMGTFVLDENTTLASLSLFGETTDAELLGVKSDGGTMTWRGQTSDGGSVTLTRVDGVIAGTIRDHHTLTRLMPSAGGTIVERIEEAAMPPDPEPIPGYVPDLDQMPPFTRPSTTTSTIEMARAWARSCSSAP